MIMLTVILMKTTGHMVIGIIENIFTSYGVVCHIVKIAGSKKITGHGIKKQLTLVFVIGIIICITQMMVIVYILN